MAQRRMFSKIITESDSFLSMSVTAQNLYFHLGMAADDDGFVPFLKVSKMLGTSHDDLAQLLGRGFLIKFTLGVCVIRDWKINNEIRTDRYQPTMYQEEFKQLGLNGSKQYFLSGEPLVVPDDNHLETQVRVGKDRIGKGTDTIAPQAVPLNDLIKMFEPLNPSYERLYANKSQRASLERLLKKHGPEKLKKCIEFCVTIFGKDMAPVITTPYQLETKLGALVSYWKRSSDKGAQIISI